MKAITAVVSGESLLLAVGGDPGDEVYSVYFAVSTLVSGFKHPRTQLRVSGHGAGHLDLPWRSEGSPLESVCY